MSVTIGSDVPGALAEEARGKELLERWRLIGLIKREGVSKSALKSYIDMVEGMRAYPDEPMTMVEIQVEVDAVRAVRCLRGEGDG